MKGGRVGQRRTTVWLGVVGGLLGLALIAPTAEGAAACTLWDMTSTVRVRCPGGTFPTTCAAGTSLLGFDPGDGVLKYCLGGGAGGTFRPFDLDAAFDRGDTIDGATSESTAVEIGNGTDEWLFWGESGAPHWVGKCGGLGCGMTLEVGDDLDMSLVVGQNGTISFWNAESGTLADEMLRLDSGRIGVLDIPVRSTNPTAAESSRAGIFAKSDGVYAVNSAGTVVGPLGSSGGSKTVPAINLRPDGSQCVAGVGQINSGPIEDFITCAANAASIVYGSINMADIGGCPTSTLNLTALVRSAGSAVFDANFSAMYRRWGSTDVINSTWSSDVAANVTLGTANEIEVATASVTPNGTCTTGSTMLFFRYKIDSANHTATTANLLGVVIARP